MKPSKEMKAKVYSHMKDVFKWTLDNEEPIRISSPSLRTYRTRTPRNLMRDVARFYLTFTHTESRVFVDIDRLGSEPYVVGLDERIHIDDFELYLAMLNMLQAELERRG